MYMLNRVGLKLNPCLTPRWEEVSVFLSYLNCTQVFPPTPLSINLNRPSCQIESKAFLKSTKQENNLLMFWFIWWSMRVLNVNIWSVVR